MLPMHAVISGLKVNSLVGSCEQNAVLGDLDGMENRVAGRRI